MYGVATSTRLAVARTRAQQVNVLHFVQSMTDQQLKIVMTNQQFTMMVTSFVLPVDSVQFVNFLYT
jgi:hypothetical protein